MEITDSPETSATKDLICYNHLTARISFTPQQKPKILRCFHSISVRLLIYRNLSSIVAIFDAFVPSYF
jgi:hypothetical protein